MNSILNFDALPSMFLMIFSPIQIFYFHTENMAERIINKNRGLYGPGPLARRSAGLGARPPLQGLVICAAQGIAFGLAGGFIYNVALGNPLVKKIEDYYKENPTR
jgi:hypothetical protein